MDISPFIEPFFVGLAYALLLPLVGCYLRLRDEWLAALSFAQVAAAGALGAMLLEIPLFIGGVIGAAAAAWLKNLASRAGNAAYALLLLAGWALSVLLVANAPMAERLGHALFDGQLYFVGDEQLYIAWGCCLLTLLALRHFSNGLLWARFFPDLQEARGGALKVIQLGFDLLAAAALAMATMSIGVMGAFALVFIPPWVVYAWSDNWRSALKIAAFIGVMLYCVAFITALLTDQPFGPVLALFLVLMGGAGVLLQRKAAWLAA